ncbi:MAG: hypothetical protein RLZZ463_216 [Bacteroidota bacterium]
MRLPLLLLWLGVIHLATYAKATQTLNDTLLPPMDIPMVLAGNFAELRNNHFHAGLDLKTQQREGIPIRSVADGYVSRIKVSPWGYGKVIYITHPNQTTTVYAHLQKFSGPIETFVKKEQYEAESYEIERFLTPEQLPVTQGMLIGLSGNTGSSAAPHLHFEIRDTPSADPLNPAALGIRINDQTPPMIQQLWLYEPWKNLDQIKKRQIPIQLPQQGSWIASEVRISGPSALGVAGFDRQDGAANRNGIYGYRVKLGDRVLYEKTHQRFSFSDDAKFNYLIDYPQYQKNRTMVRWLFAPDDQKQGWFTLAINQRDTLHLEVWDLNGNMTHGKIPVLGTVAERGISPPWSDATAPQGHVTILPDQPWQYQSGNWQINIPQHAFFEKTALLVAEKKSGILIGNPQIPLAKSIGIRQSMDSIPEHRKPFASLMRITEKGGRVFVPTTRKDNELSTWTKILGHYQVGFDSIPPSIQPKNFVRQQKLPFFNFLTFKISDVGSGIQSYRGTINGKWMLLAYEPKKAQLTYDADHLVDAPGVYEIRLEVTDQVGNQSVFSTQITKTK